MGIGRETDSWICEMGKKNSGSGDGRFDCDWKSEVSVFVSAGRHLIGADYRKAVEEGPEDMISEGNIERESRSSKRRGKCYIDLAP